MQRINNNNVTHIFFMCRTKIQFIIHCWEFDKQKSLFCFESILPFSFANLRWKNKYDGRDNSCLSNLLNENLEIIQTNLCNHHQKGNMLYNIFGVQLTPRFNLFFFIK
ncbi:hypothetical protein NQ317_008570 [Molorchus minor]|uniref:Uncharacterized protein n=1 Tax=Molorchus minor TaxID=1323400 RepID=A0ABQ9JRC0_9CUCU|nr:hypothetical protein NQ317_008570 [Molorchus minor]